MNRNIPLQQRRSIIKMPLEDYTGENVLLSVPSKMLQQFPAAKGVSDTTDRTDDNSSFASSSDYSALWVWNCGKSGWQGDDECFESISESLISVQKDENLTRIQLPAAAAASTSSKKAKAKINQSILEIESTSNSTMTPLPRNTKISRSVSANSKISNSSRGSLPAKREWKSFFANEMMASSTKQKSSANARRRMTRLSTGNVELSATNHSRDFSMFQKKCQRSSFSNPLSPKIQKKFPLNPAELRRRSFQEDKLERQASIRRSLSVFELKELKEEMEGQDLKSAKGVGRSKQRQFSRELSSFSRRVDMAGREHTNEVFPSSMDKAPIQSQSC
jgi:hypothetical protein